MADRDLTTIESYRDYQQASGAAAAAQTSLIASTITEVSDAIMDFCQREFAPSVEDDTRAFRYDGCGVLSLAPFDARVVTAVEIDTDTDSPTSLDPSSWRLAPLPSRSGVFHTMHLRGVGVTEVLTDPSPSYRVVSVTGSWGWAEVPDAVRRAANMTVGYLMRTGSQHQGDEMDGLSAGWGGSGVLIPGNAKRLLAPYRHYSAGA